MAQSQDDPLIGKRLAHYQILEKLGKGGMGVVYKARNIELGRLCALKLLSPQLATDQQFVKRFLREARSAAAIEHPNIVMVYNVGEDQGRYFIEMQLIEGKTLNRILAERGSLPLIEATQIVRGTARALHFAHTKLIIHRDIKPDNIMLIEDKSLDADSLYHGRYDDLVRVTDFGLARPELDTMHITKSGVSVGTPEYMSPEQWDGRNVDRRTDIYALGITYFHVLTGRPPFDGATPYEVMRKHKEEYVPNPNHYAPHLPNSVYPIIKKATAKSPFDRYLTMAEFIRDLDSLEHTVTLGRNQGTEYVVPAQQTPLPIKPPKQVPPRPPIGRVHKRATPRSGITKRKRKQLLVSSFLIVFGTILLLVIIIISNSPVDISPSDPGKMGDNPPPQVDPLDRDRDSLAPMVLVPGGVYMLGDVDTQRIKIRSRPVYLEPFYIDKYEVTNDRYRRFLIWMKKYNDHTLCHPEETDRDHTPYDYGIPALKQADHPVVGINWYDAYAFAAWAGKRLPTEDEWEAAARGKSRRRFPWGEELPDAERRYRMNYQPVVGGRPTPEADGFAYSAPVGSFPDDLSEFGCYDMAGNVSEYVSNGPAQGYVTLRGFSSYNLMPRELMYPLVLPQNIAKQPTTADQLEQLKYVGFRCVKDKK